MRDFLCGGVKNQMNININGVYIIDDQFFKDFPDPYLRGNDKENRPHYYAFKEEGYDLYWMVPMSHQVDKYKSIIKEKEDAGKPCDILHIIEINGEESVFLFADMFPVTIQYIKREYTINNIPLVLKDNSQIRVLNKKAKRIHFLLTKKNVKFTKTQPDVNKIRASLIYTSSK